MGQAGGQAVWKGHLPWADLGPSVLAAPTCDGWHFPPVHPCSVASSPPSLLTEEAAPWPLGCSNLIAH